MLDKYIGECMVSIINVSIMIALPNINNDIEKITCEYQNTNTGPILIFCEYVKVRESLYAQVMNGSIPF